MVKIMKTVDLVIPCYNESESVDLFYDHCSKVVDKIDGYSFTFIFINDGSRDDTLAKIKKIAEKDSRVKYISFSRNFKKEAAMYAGLKASSAERVAIIDADLQHPPELIADMLYAIDVEGYDSCSARRISREGEPKIKSMFSRLFYRIINKMSEVEIIDGAVDFRMMTRQMVNAILEMPEVGRFSKGIFCWIGFETKWIEFKNIERIAGETTWSFFSLFKYAIDGITAFTTFPLRIATIVGALIATGTFFYFIFELIKNIFGERDLPGYASTIIILLFGISVIVMGLGIIGEYLARMYMETKRRPVFITKETNIDDGKTATKK